MKKSPCQYPHERKVLVVTLRGIIVTILDRFVIEWSSFDESFYKKDEKHTKIATLEEILKGL